jgi:DNA uptake protein ComE-like DNA-binding protein
MTGFSADNDMQENYIDRPNARVDRVRLNAFLVAAAAALVFCLYFMLAAVSAAGSQQVIDLESRVNPNDASAASLMRLPGLGLVRANEIIEYRKQFSQGGKSDLAFRDCNDLRKVKGIGPKTAQGMCEWLKFK